MSITNKDVDISVVIPTYNRKNLLRCLLKSLAKQANESLREVVVVDDGSTDGTSEMLACQKLPYTLRIVGGQHRGPAAARNQGIEASAAAVVLFLDDDVIPCPEFLPAHVSRHLADDNAVVIGKLTPCPDSHPPGWERWEQWMLTRLYRRLSLSHVAVDGSLFYTGNVSARRSSLRDVGGFDITLAYLEDVDLGRRLETAGARFFFAPEAEGRHCGRRSFEGWCHRYYQFGRHRFIRHNRSNNPSLSPLVGHYQQLNSLTRLLVKSVVGRPHATRATVTLLRCMAAVLDQLHVLPLSRYAYSAIANLLDCSGIQDAAGGQHAFWEVVRSGQSSRNGKQTSSNPPVQW